MRLTTRRLFLLALALVVCAVSCASMPVITSAASTSPKLPLGWPKVVVIPRLGISAKIEDIALSSVTDVEAPHDLNDVAWYSRGHRPGERGRAQIFGHLDSTCCPALFYHLRDMRRGDLVYVQYKSGAPLKFQVQWSATYPTTHMPYSFMYGPTTDRGLILVTCTGIFHRDGTGYDHRLIVYSTLVLPKPPTKPHHAKSKAEHGKPKPKPKPKKSKGKLSETNQSSE